MLLNQGRAQLVKARTRVGSSQQLIRIGAAIVRHCYRFAAPDQFCTAGAKAPPATKRPFGRVAVGSSVPTLHRMDRDAISQPNATADQLLTQRRFPSAERLWIAGDPRLQRFEALHKAGGPLQRRNAHDSRTTQLVDRFLGSAITAHAPMSAIPIRTTKPMR